MQYTTSMIIGLWRMGATIEQMIGLTLLSCDEINQIINQYKNKKK